MADEKDKITKLEERLANAAVTFKDMKAQLETKEKENEELKLRVSELEGEITLNGGAAEEVEGLKQRLEKAKGIFANQQEKITSLTKAGAEAKDQITSLNDQIEELKKTITDLDVQLHAFSQANEALRTTIKQIRDIANIE